MGMLHLLKTERLRQKGEGSADISVTNGVKTKTVSVNVSKNQINGFSMTVKEPSGDDQSSIILTAKGLPADVSGNVIFYDVTGGQKTLLYKAEAAATVEYTYETDSLLGAKQFEACIAVMKNMRRDGNSNRKLWENTGNYDRR